VLSRPLPVHVGIIMDGNGRWAEGKGRPRLLGHREGSVSVREVTRAARRFGVRYLTLYAFSAQNWLRPVSEVEGLMDLLSEYLRSEREEILDNGIRLNAIGDLARLPPRVRDYLTELMEASADNDEMTLSLALSYGGREEILQAVQKIAADVAAGKLAPDAIDAATFQTKLWTAALPDPDLIIRTSGELRLSNFLLYQAAYTEMVVTPAHWPAFREREFLLALREFQDRERRFGQTGAQRRGPEAGTPVVTHLVS
jgi:undecaprenyl diphosphate synthase